MDCLYALQSTFPHLSCSLLHRLFQRHSITQLQEIENHPSARKRFNAYPVDYFHIDIAEVRMEAGKLYLFVAIDRTSKFIYIELLEKTVEKRSHCFFKKSYQSAPYKIHTILTDNRIQFTDMAVDKYAFTHIFDRICHRHH